MAQWVKMLAAKADCPRRRTNPHEFSSTLHTCHGRGTRCTHAHTHIQTEIGVFTIPAGAGAAAYLQIGEQSPKAQDYKACGMKPGCWATAANEMRKPQWISYPELEGGRGAVALGGQAGVQGQQGCIEFKARLGNRWDPVSKKQQKRTRLMASFLIPPIFQILFAKVYLIKLYYNPTVHYYPVPRDCKGMNDASLWFQVIRFGFFAL